MKHLIRKLSLFFYVLLLSIAFVACSENEDGEDPSPALDCTVDVAECLTNGSNQTYSVYRVNGSTTINNECIESFQLNFNIDGAFIWFHTCPEEARLISPFTGEWTLENDKTEIHVPLPNDAPTQEWIIPILELSEEELVFPVQRFGINGLTVDTLTWKRF